MTACWAREPPSLWSSLFPRKKDKYPSVFFAIFRFVSHKNPDLSLKKSTYLVVFLLGLAVQQGYSQSFVQIGGSPINDYTAITSILSDDDNNVDSVVVVNAAAFSVDDTVMIYCVKGAAIGDGGLYPVGEDAQQPRNTGKYAFLLIEDMVGNVWQMTSDLYDNGSYYFLMIRGGSYYNPTSSWWYVQGGPQRLDKRQMLLLVCPGLIRNATVGFRCVMDISN